MTIPSSGETVSALAGGLRPDIQHNNYVALHTNLLVIYIIRMKSHLAVPLLTKVDIAKPTAANWPFCLNLYIYYFP